VIVQRYGLERVEGMLNYLLLLPNILLISPSFRWYLIEADHDDDKFVDCYIVGNADHLVGNDKHFNVLKYSDFPRFSLLKYEEFEAMYKDKLS